MLYFRKVNAESRSKNLKSTSYWLNKMRAEYFDGVDLDKDNEALFTAVTPPRCAAWRVKSSPRATAIRRSSRRSDAGQPASRNETRRPRWAARVFRACRRALFARDLQGEASSGSHLHRQLPVGGNFDRLAFVVAGRLVGVDAVAEQFGGVGRPRPGSRGLWSGYGRSSRSCRRRTRCRPCGVRWRRTPRRGRRDPRSHPKSSGRRRELRAFRLAHVVRRRVAQHVERRFEDHVFGQLAAARALAHGLGAYGAEVPARGVCGARV